MNTAIIPAGNYAAIVRNQAQEAQTSENNFAYVKGHDLFPAKDKNDGAYRNLIAPNQVTFQESTMLTAGNSTPQNEVEQSLRELRFHAAKLRRLDKQEFVRFADELVAESNAIKSTSPVTDHRRRRTTGSRRNDPSVIALMDSIREFREEIG